MKTRTGFVSNSSSSSFICSICHRTESGMNSSLHDFEMVECEKCYSTFCLDHSDYKYPNRDQKIELLWKKAENESFLKNIMTEKLDAHNEALKNHTRDTYYQELVDYHNSIYYEYFEDEDYISSDHCPICQMKEILDMDLMNYILKKYNLSEEFLKSEITDKFKSRDEFLKFIGVKS